MDSSAATDGGRPPRRARQQRSVDTRQRLLDAAVEVLDRHGYAGATTVRIQEVAGVSRGRLLHHFPARVDLLVAAVRHLTDARIAEAVEEHAVPDDPRERVERAVGRMWRFYRQRFFWASAELWLAARHDEALRAALLPGEREVGALVRRSSARFFGDLADHPAYDGLHELLNSSMRGVALTYAFNPRDPDADAHVPAWVGLALRTLGVVETPWYS